MTKLPAGKYRRIFSDFIAAYDDSRYSQGQNPVVSYSTWSALASVCHLCIAGKLVSNSDSNTAQTGSDKSSWKVALPTPHIFDIVSAEANWYRLGECVRLSGVSYFQAHRSLPK